MRSAEMAIAMALLMAPLGAAPGPGAAEPLQGDWVQVTPQAAFSPRDTAEDLVYDGKMWLSNGYFNGNVLTRDLWCSTDGANWTRVNESTPYDGYSEMVVYQGKMWAIKGSVWTSTDGVKWTQVSEKTPFGVRGYGEAVIFKDEIWQLGSGADVWHTRDGVNWTCATENAPYGKRYAASVAVLGGKLWVMGGSSPGANTPPEKGYKETTTHNDVWCSEDGKNWTRAVEHAPWAPRQWCVAKTYRDRIWLLGGYDNVNARNLGDVWCTEDGKAWRELQAKTSFKPRHEVTAYVYQESLWVVAGNTWPLVNDAWRLKLP